MSSEPVPVRRSKTLPPGTPFDSTRTTRAQRRMPTERQLAETADLFSALDDGTRLKIVFALAAAGELCVSDLSLVVGMNLSAISTQLRLLRGLGVVSRRHEGKMAFYFLRGTSVADLARRALRYATRA